MRDYLDHPVEPKKLDVFAATAEAYRGAWNHFGEMVRLMWLPCGLYIAVSIVGSLLDEKQVTLQFALELAALFLWPIIAVAWHRFVLVGDAAPGSFHLHFGRREARYLMISIFLGLLFLPGVLVVLMTASLNDPSVGPAASLLGFAGFLVLMVGVYFAVRLLLLLPAVAVDEPVNVRLILERTRGNFWRVLALIFIASLPLFFIMFCIAALVVFFAVPMLYATIPVALISVFFMIVSVAVLSISYRELIGPPGTLAFDLEGPDLPVS
jgi:hypothetical protein